MFGNMPKASVANTLRGPPNTAAQAEAETPPFESDSELPGKLLGYNAQCAALAVASHVHADNRPLHGKPKTYRRDEYLNAEANRIVCAAHSALFDVDPGLCVLGSWLFERLRSMTWHMAEDRLLF